MKKLEFGAKAASSLGGWMVKVAGQAVAAILAGLVLATCVPPPPG